MPDKPKGYQIAVNTRLLLPEGMEGVGRFTHEVCKRLVALRPEDQFWFFFDRDFSSQFVYNSNVEPCILFPQARHPVLFKWWFDYSVPRMLHKVKADLFYSPDGFGSLRTQVPQLISVHDLAYIHFPEQLPRINLWYYRRYVRRFLQKADRLHAVSTFTARDIHTSFPDIKTPVSVIHNGPDEGYAPLSNEQKNKARARLTEGLPYFIYAGAIHPRKNILTLLKAYELLRQQFSGRVKLILAGRMAWKTGEISRFIQNCPFRDDIILPGFVPAEDLPEMIGAADALVYPSVFEGFGIPVLNAMLAGVPVITSRNSAMHEVTQQHAMLIDPYSESAIAAAMLRVMSNDKTMVAMVSKALARGKEFSWDNTAQALSGEFNKMLSQK